MPLCPTCIREHTQYHQDIKTKPIYFSIQEVTTEVRELIFAAIKQLEQDNLKRVDLKLDRLNYPKESIAGIIISRRVWPRQNSWYLDGWRKSLKR